MLETIPSINTKEFDVIATLVYTHPLYKDWVEEREGMFSPKELVALEEKYKKGITAGQIYAEFKNIKKLKLSESSFYHYKVRGLIPWPIKDKNSTGFILNHYYPPTVFRLVNLIEIAKCLGIVRWIKVRTDLLEGKVVIWGEVLREFPELNKVDSILNKSIDSLLDILYKIEKMGGGRTKVLDTVKFNKGKILDTKFSLYSLIKFLREEIV